MNKNLQIFISILLLVVLIFVIYGVFFKKPFKEKIDPNVVQFETILTTVEGGEYSYLKMELAIKAKDKSSTKTIQNNRAQIRALILQVSSKQDGKEVLYNKERFKNLLIKTLQDRAGLGVDDIYFTNFVLAK